MISSFVRASLFAFLVASPVALPGLASAHTMLNVPKPRDDGQLGADAHKTGPCGVTRADAPNAKVTAYSKGATIPVFYTETIDHQGCFKVQLSQANDDQWTTLATIADPLGDTAGRVVRSDVQLPADLTCAACTLRVTQLMIGRACTEADTPEGSSTYYTCANISIIDGDAGAPPIYEFDAGAPRSDAGTGTPSEGDASTPDAGRGGDDDPDDSVTGTTPARDASTGPGTTRRSPNLTAAAPGGCAVTMRESSPAGALVTAGLAVLGLAVVRRRRRGAR